MLAGSVKMSMARVPQLHFDGDPGKTSLVVVPLPVPTHTSFDPGCRQVVAEGQLQLFAGGARGTAW